MKFTVNRSASFRVFFKVVEELVRNEKAPEMTDALGAVFCALKHVYDRARFAQGLKADREAPFISHVNVYLAAEEYWTFLHEHGGDRDTKTFCVYAQEGALFHILGVIKAYLGHELTSVEERAVLAVLSGVDEFVKETANADYQAACM